MTIRDAYTLFKLSDTSTERELAASYRRLVKHYHPDNNANRLDWAHRRMTQINQAYALVCDHMRDGMTQAVGGAAGVDDADASARGWARAGADENFNHDPGPWRERQPSVDELTHAGVALDEVLDGVYMYYQYGLQNIHRRYEGVTRLRYRKTIRHLKAGARHLQNHMEQYGPTLRQTEDIHKLSVFSRSFLRNVAIDKYYIPSSNSREAKAYRHYRAGSEYLDSAIQQILFGEQFTPGLARSHSGSLYVSSHELVTVLVNYRDSTWIPETMIKLDLLDAFSAAAEAGSFAMI
jgi:curved DNA-binding protein CbpA